MVSEETMKVLKRAFISSWLHDFIFSSILWIVIFILSGLFYWNKPELVLWIGIVDFILFFIYNTFLFYHYFKEDWKRCEEEVEEDERQREEIKQLRCQLAELNITENSK